MSKTRSCVNMWSVEIRSTYYYIWVRAIKTTIRDYLTLTQYIVTPLYNTSFASDLISNRPHRSNDHWTYDPYHTVFVLTRIVVASSTPFDTSNCMRSSTILTWLFCLQSALTVTVVFFIYKNWFFCWGNHLNVWIWTNHVRSERIFVTLLNIQKHS